MNQIGFPPLTDVVKHLLAINVLLFLGTTLLWGDWAIQETATGGISIHPNRYWLAAFFPTSEYFRPYQICTHMFMHKDIGHLFFNMLSLWMFGTSVEMVFGPKRFLFYYLTCGLGAYALHLLVMWYQISHGTAGDMAENIPMLGASGAIFGLYIAYGFLFPERELYLMFPPIPIKAKYLVGMFAIAELYMGFGNLQPGVAHFAHIGGAITGFLLLMKWYRMRFR